MDKLEGVINSVDKSLVSKTKKVKNKTFAIEKDNTKWIGQDIETYSDPIIDPGVGKAYVLRYFEFARNPEFKGTLTKQELFNMHWRQIRNLLWGDGLRPVEDINPRIEFTKDNKYRIFILAEPRLNTMLNEKPKKLHEILNKRKK